MNFKLEKEEIENTKNEITSVTNYYFKKRESIIDEINRMHIESFNVEKLNSYFHYINHLRERVINTKTDIKSLQFLVNFSKDSEELKRIVNEKMDFRQSIFSTIIEVTKTLIISCGVQVEPENTSPITLIEKKPENIEAKLLSVEIEEKAIPIALFCYCLEKTKVERFLYSDDAADFCKRVCEKYGIKYLLQVRKEYYKSKDIANHHIEKMVNNLLPTVKDENDLALIKSYIENNFKPKSVYKIK